MNQVKFYFFVVCCVLSINTFAADNLTEAQRQFRTSIMSYLRTEGFAPTIDEDDGSIKFKREGTQHWIYIQEGDPYFIMIQTTGFLLSGEDKYDYAPALLACNEITKSKKGVKLVCGEKAVQITMEYFVDSITSFKATFYRYINALRTGKGEFTDKYYEYEKKQK